MSDERTGSSGWRPWAAWALGSLFFCYGFFLRVAPSVMVEDLMRDFAVGAAILGNLSAFYFYAYATLQIPVGLLLDRFGPRRLMSAAALVCALGCVVFALAPSLPIAYAGRLLVGIGAGFSWVGALTLVTLYFPPRRFALLVGIAQLCGMLGAVFGQAPLAQAVAAFGWRGTQLFAAVLGVAMALLLFAVVRDRPRRGMDGGVPVSLMAGLRLVARNGQTWACALVGGAMTAMPLAFGGLWGVPYLVRTFSIDRPAAAFSVSLCFLGFGLGASTLGLLSDALRRRKPVIVAGTGLVLATLLAMFYLPGLSLTGFVILMMVCGFGSGSMVVAFAAARELNPPHAAGATYGLVNMFVVGSGAVFQPLIGGILDALWTSETLDGARIYPAEAYRIALGVLPAMAAIGLVSALAMRETGATQRG